MVLSYNVKYGADLDSPLLLIITSSKLFNQGFSKVKFFIFHSSYFCPY